MASALSQLDVHNLNPHFFAYGQFPLYLGLISLKIFHLTNIFLNSVLVLRFWSATFSLLSIFVLYKISKIIIKNNFTQKIFILLLIFNPGLIQLSHFGTTDSLLILVFLSNIYFSLKYLIKPIYLYIFFASIISGLGLASKISALSLTTPIFLCILFSKSKLSIKILLTVSSSLLFTFFFIIFSPYNLIEFSSFLSTINYETSVAIGKINVFYTHQFLNTTPYLYQFTHIFPYVSGLPVFIFSLFSLFFIRKKNIFKFKYLLIILPCLVYFLYMGQLFVKWTRFMSPIFFVFPLLATIFISKIKYKLIQHLLIIITIVPGILFINLYFQKDIRVQASEWIEKNIPENSRILSEAGNVANIPLTNKNYQVINYDFYNLDNNTQLKDGLDKLLIDSEYILIPSRRIFNNQNNPQFPVSQQYYQNLFSGKSGFKLIKQFSINNNFLLNHENAEETFSVFDQPIIRIYKKE